MRVHVEQGPASNEQAGVAIMLFAEMFNDFILEKSKKEKLFTDSLDKK